MNEPLDFPDDENGDVLRQMAEQGDDLSVAREIDFSVIFPTEEAALQFAVLLLRNGQKVSFSEYEEDEERPWEVQAHPFMVPTHDNISGYESLLASEAESLGGLNDGWGCVVQE